MTTFTDRAASLAGLGWPGVPLEPCGPGIYVHIPFCLAKCAYCDFNSYPARGGVPEWYLAGLARDIAREAGAWPERFETVYFGGGTPSLLEPGQVAGIMECLANSFMLAAEPEITLECNPATVTRASLACYRAAGVTRVSVGVQSLSEQELRVLGRKHDPDQALAALAAARRAGFADVSADVMIGIPGQTAASLAATLKRVVDRVTHVSVYMLTIEPGTPLADWVLGGLVREPDDETLADLYQRAASILAAGGLARYEISNFARAGRPSRHNLNYWRRGNYVGIGAGAHSHRYGRRCAKIRSPSDYSRASASSASVVDFEETLSADQQVLEEIMLGLRTSMGIAARLPERLTPAGRAALAGKVRELVRGGLVVRECDTFTLSPKGILLHDAVCGELARALSAARSGTHLPN